MIECIDFLIALPIPFDFGNPEFPVGLDVLLAVFPVVAMPEGSIDKNDELVFFQTDIRLAGKGFLGCFIPDACSPKRFFEKQFRFRSLGPNARHIVRALFGRIESVGLTKLGYRNFGNYVRLILQRIDFFTSPPPSPLGEGACSVIELNF